MWKNRITRTRLLDLLQRRLCKRTVRAQQKFSLFLYILLDLGARLRYDGSGERFPRFVEYSARRRPRCRIPGRRYPRTVPRR